MTDSTGADLPNSNEPLPLAGIRIVDFSQMIAGPSASVMLADYGADVIKVEPPAGDGCRLLCSAPALALPEAPVFTAYNRNKRSMRLNLRDEADLQVAYELLAEADVMIASAAPGVMDRLGLGRAAVLERFPRMVYASLSGFGETGLGRNRKGLDLIVQAESGIMATTGLPEVPVKVGFTVVDAASAHALCHGILAALFRRERTGLGAYISTSLYAVALQLQTGPLSEYLATGVQDERTGSAALLSAPAGLMRCRDGAIVISAYLDAHWLKFCDAIGDPTMALDPRFANVEDRVTNRPALTERIEAALAKRDAEDWLEKFRAIGLVCGELKDYAAVVADPCAIESGLIMPMATGHAILNPIAIADCPRPTPRNRTEIEPALR